MTITIDSQKALLVLLAALAVLYAANIFATGKLTDMMVEKPIEISFILIPAPEGACDECINPEEIVQVIDGAHNISYDTTVIDYDSVIGEKYIDMYNLVSLPAIVVSGDIANDALIGAWNSFSARVEDEQVIIENLLPYYELSSKTVRGVADIVLLSDSTCANCFDASAYLNILERFGVTTGSVETYDVSSAKGSELVSKYKITKVPAMITSPEVKVYKNLADSWGQIGTVEEDGWFILREVQKISTEFKSI